VDARVLGGCHLSGRLLRGPGVCVSKGWGGEVVGWCRKNKEGTSGHTSIGYCGLKVNFSLYVSPWYIGFESMTWMSMSHVWKSSALMSIMPGGSFSCICSP
jgi:hypothetical protein